MPPVCSGVIDGSELLLKAREIEAMSKMEYRLNMSLSTMQEHKSVLQQDINKLNREWEEKQCRGGEFPVNSN